MTNVYLTLKIFTLRVSFVLTAGFLALSMATGCSDSQVSGGDIQTPTVDPLPPKTNNPRHKISGTRSLNTSIWIQYQGSEQKLLAAAGEDTKWEGELELKEGDNNFVVLATYKGDSNVSPASPVIGIILDTIPPNPPVVVGAPEFVSLGEDGIGTLTLLGTKDSNSDLRSGQGGAQVVVGLSADVDWTMSLAINAGQNSISLYSADDVGNMSEPTTVSVFGSNIEAPTFNPEPTSPTNESNPVLAGTKSGNTSVYLKHTFVDSNGDVVTAMSGDEIIALSSSTAWSYPDIVLEEGTNRLEIYSKVAGVDAPSGSAVATVVLDTTPPNPPELDSVAETTSTASVLIAGTKDIDGNLCLRRGQEANCQEIASIQSGEEFSVNTSLVAGANQLFFSSVDAIGNASAEVAVTVYKMGGPDITFLHPQNGDVLVAGNFTIAAKVSGQHCSHDFSIECQSDSDCGANSECIPQTALNTVKFCVDNQPCEEATRDPGTGEYLMDFDAVAAGWQVGSAHSIQCEAINLGGFISTESINVIYNFGVTNVSNTLTPGHSRDVAMAAESDGTLHFVWSDQCIQYGFGDEGTKCRESQSGNSPNDIFHRSFSAGQWSSITLISDGGGDSVMDGSDETPAVAIDNNGLLHIAWSSNGQFASSGGDFDIFHRTVDLGTNTLGDIVVVDNQSTTQSSPDIEAAADGTVHLVWEAVEEGGDIDIYHARWSGSWSQSTKVSDHPNDGVSTVPALAIDSTSTAHIVWQELGRIEQNINFDADIYHRTLVVGPNGVGLGDYLLVSDSGSDNTQNAASRSPAVMIDSAGSFDRVVIAWEDSLNSLAMGADTDIFLRSYIADGCIQPNGWCAESQIYQKVSVGSTANSESAQLSILESGEIVVAWSEAADAASQPNIKYTSQRIALDGTIIFWPTADLSATSGMSTNVEVLVDEAGNLHFAWQDRGNESSDVFDGENPNGEEDDDIFYQVIVIER